MFLSDEEIQKRCLTDRPMIYPFVAKQVRSGVVSFGLSSAGYDISVAGEDIKVFTRVNVGEIDPKNFDPSIYQPAKIHTDTDGSFFRIPGNSFVLCHTVEKFIIPRDIITVCLGKSTYARVGLAVNVTPFEPEWEGYATMELSNTSPAPVRVYVNEGIAQLLFAQITGRVMVSYADKKGKYQRQGKETTLAMVDSVDGSKLYFVKDKPGDIADDWVGKGGVE